MAVQRSQKEAFVAASAAVVAVPNLPSAAGTLQESTAGAAIYPTARQDLLLGLLNLFDIDGPVRGCFQMPQQPGRPLQVLTWCNAQ